MANPKLIRITTVPLSLEKLLEGQLAFMQQYFNVTAISAEKDRLQEFGQNEGVKTFHIELTRKITPLKDIASVWKLYKFLKREKPQIVHTHTPKAGIVGMLGSWLAGVPNRLHTVAGLPLMEAQGVKRSILITVERCTYRLATKIYPNAKGLKDFIIENKLVKPSKLKIIANGSSNGIDTQYFNPEHISDAENTVLRKKLSIAENDFVFVFVGRLVKDKGINELVSAFQKVNKQYPKTTLLLVGPLETELDPLLPTTINKINTNSKIIATGYQPDVRLYFSISDVLVFPSYREGFPNVVMQAGAMGLPAIVTNINGCNEIISVGENGIFIQPKNENDIYKAMLEMITEPTKFEKLKINARLAIVSKYQQAEVWQALLQEYNSIIES